MTFVIGTKANDEWEGNEDGGVSGNSTHWSTWN